MRRVLVVAQREFMATAATKAFVFGILLTPAIIGAMIVLFPRLLRDDAPKVVGRLAVVDPTGQLRSSIDDYLSPQAMMERRSEERAEAVEQLPDGLQALGQADDPEAREALDEVLGELPDIEVAELPPGADLQAEKRSLIGERTDGSLLALVVIHDDALERRGSGSYGTYDLFVRSQLDDRVEDEISAALRRSIVDARIRAAGMAESDIRELTRVERVRSITVTEGGERETNEALNTLIPVGFMGLLMISVLTSGQSLMTTTIEEKSSKVVEVLLSAVSPLELMTGKILGQMAVGFTVLVLYAALGSLALASFAAFGLVDPLMVLYLVLFYLVAYPCVAALMGAIGAAVNNLPEAQALMMPVMLIIMVPWILWLPISRAPDSMLATVTSFIPPISSFVMLLRMTTPMPPPAWQVWLSLAIGAVAVYGALWFAAKVFRVGLLMHGKPPDLRTLIRWVRMA